MRRTFFLILLCLASIPIGISTAQSRCTINLEEPILQLVQAQRAADTGDTLLAASILQSVQSRIDTITNGCDSIQLTGKFTSSDESMSFNYPEGWTVEHIEGGPIIVASSPALVDLLNNDLPESIPVGEAAIAILAQPIDDTFDDTLDELMDEIQDEFRLLSPIEDSIIKGRRVISMSIAFNENVSGRISLTDYSDGGTSTALLVFGVADTASLPIIEVYTDALRQSIQYPPGVSLQNVGVAWESLSYTEVINLIDENNFSPSTPVSLSPDGTMVAWETKDELCLQNLNQPEDCTPLPESFGGRAALLQWSPDGRYIAFQENALIYMVDADVWLFDVADGRFIHLTDDGEAEFGFGEAETDIWMDTVMTWGPDNQIYLLRTAIEAGKEHDERTYELLRLDPNTGDTTLIQDLTGKFEPFPVYYQQQFSLDGVMSVSPDATQMAISVTEFERDSLNNGIWLIDLVGGNAPQHIATANQFMTAYSADLYEENPFSAIESLAWDADATGLYVYALSIRDLFPVNMLYHMDLDSGDVILLVDLSAYTQDELLAEVYPEDGEDSPLSEAEFIPRSPVLSPDYRAVIVANGDRTALLAIPFDGQFGEPVALYENDEMELFGSTSFMGSNGTALIAGNLFISD